MRKRTKADETTDTSVKRCKKLSKKWKAVIACAVILCVVGTALGVYFGLFADASYFFDLEHYLKTAELVFSDEFDGNAVNEANWTVEGKDAEGGRIPRRGGYWTDEAVSVKDGNLTIKTYKAEDGHYYTGSLTSENKYENRFGYYEIRCKLPSAYGIWSAFWLMPSDGAFDTENPDATVAGAEIDVFEAPAYPKATVQQAVHIGGYGKNHKSVFNVKWLVADFGDLYNEFHTYGVYWNKDIYIFYVDGEAVWKTDVSDNVSTLSQYMIISTEVGGKTVGGEPVPGVAWGNPVLFKSPDDELNDWSDSADFVVDYVRHYR